MKVPVDLTVKAILSAACPHGHLLVYHVLGGYNKLYRNYCSNYPISIHMVARKT